MRKGKLTMERFEHKVKVTCYDDSTVVVNRVLNKPTLDDTEKYAIEHYAVGNGEIWAIDWTVDGKEQNWFLHTG